MNDEFDHKFDLLKQEIDNLQNGIRNYDTILFTVKGWAITIFSAFVFFAVGKGRSVFLAFCALAIILFWLLDSIYRSIQRVYIRRYNDIERFLRSPEFAQAVQERSFKGFRIPDIGESFHVAEARKYRDILQVSFALQNAILYVVMLTLIAFIAIFTR